MTMQISPTAAAYVHSINDYDSVTFIALFASGAVVNDAGREFRGVAAINAWSDRKIFVAGGWENGPPGSTCDDVV
jgi:hypothetical protein